MPRYEQFPHQFTLDNRKYAITLPNFYDDGSNSNIGEAVGLTKIKDEDDLTGMDTVTVSEGLLTGKLIRIRIGFSGQNTNNRTKSANIICPIDNAKTAIGTIYKKKYRGNDVVSAGIPRRRRLG